MDRRTLLRHGVAATASAVAGPALARAANAAEIRQVPRTLPTESRTFELEELSVADLQTGMRSGAYTARTIAERFLTRIDEIDRRGPAISSVIEVNPDALAIADARDEERRAGRVRGPLHGIPVLVKDNVDTADKMRTSAGSLALGAFVAPRDAFLVQRLRDAGAVVLGKTNLSEWANFRSTHSSSGWSARGGQTKNPYALDRNPCGSSSGSAVAVSANLATLAVGTETDGSIVCPASACGIVGIKPTLGLVSRAGVIPIAHSQDTAGPMARSVADAAVLLGVLAGVDPRDPATSASRGRAQADYTRYLDAAGLRGARIGIARNYFGFNDAVDRVMNEAVAAMKNAGAIIIDPANIPTKGKFDDSEFEVLLYEFKADLNAYLGRLGPRAPAKSLAELIEFNERNREREMPFFGQEIFVMAQKKGPLTSKAYRLALAKNHRLSRTQGIDAVITKHRLDAIVAPTGSPAWPTDLLNGDHFTGGSSTAAAVAGYPSVTIPAGHVYGLPVGISLFASAYSEPTLIKLAYALEQTLKARKSPQFLPTVNLRS
jgi:amidase